MSGKYTPGPWRVQWQSNAFGGERLVANAGGHSSNFPGEDAHAVNCANAELIARAPLMDTALVALRDAARGLVAEIDAGAPLVTFEQTGDDSFEKTGYYDTWTLQVSVRRVNSLLAFVRRVSEEADEALGGEG